MKRLARLSLRLRLTLLFFRTDHPPPGAMASVVAWQQTTKKLDKLFDTQQMLFAKRRLSAWISTSCHAPARTCSGAKKS